jgi:transcriptional regulator with XRE-family HTH domain
MTMKELSTKVGVSERTISRWESGDIANMKRDKIAALAKDLEVEPALMRGIYVRI